MRKISIIASALLLMAAGLPSMAQVVNRQIVENGGTGPYKAEVIADATLPTHVIYRPENIKDVVAKQGKLPVILYANGACVNNNLEMRLLLNDVASYGYIAIAIGPYEEGDVCAQWKGVLLNAYPKGKKCILANGEEVKEPTPEEVKARQDAERARREAAQAAAAKAKKKSKKAEPAPAPFRTYPKQMLEAMDWITEQNANPNSEYYHMIDLDNVAAMGQSCGGAQVLAVAYDPRIKTCVMLNTGIGDNLMQGASKESLKNLHTPMFYLIGGPIDIAFDNAAKDYARIEELPIVMINTKDGHSGTYYEKHGGAYAVAARKWLDWQLKGKVGQSALFLDDEVLSQQHPDWSVVRKNF